MTIQTSVSFSELMRLDDLLEIAKRSCNEQEIQEAQEALEAYEELCIKQGKLILEQK